MAETQQKRPRDDQTIEFDDPNSNPKRQKPDNNILSLFDEEDEEHNHDLSAMFSTLEHEIYSPTAFDFDSPPFAEEDKQKTSSVAGDGADEGESASAVMRHLLEASDDELGIPNTEEYINVDEIRSYEKFSLASVDNGLWEIEDVAANYYTMLQSELFM